jgi:hypothetical protein
MLPDVKIKMQNISLELTEKIAGYELMDLLWGFPLK